MDFQDSVAWKWWKIYGKHIEAIAIIGLLILCWFTYDKNNKLQEKINDKCGWEGKDYYCVCEKSAVQSLENKLNPNKNPLGGIDLNLLNDSMVG